MSAVMMTRRRLIAGVALVATAMATAVAGHDAWAEQGPQPASQAPAPAPGQQPYTVTLVTGDRVTVGRTDATSASVEPAAGRERMTFSTSVIRGHLMVIPADAARLVQTEKVDRRLFDITELIGSGYHDAARTSVPLILSYRSTAAASTTKKAVTTSGAQVARDLPAVDGVAVTAPKPTATTLWRTLLNKDQSDTASGVERIWLDGVRRPRLDVSVPKIGAPAAWQAGYTGKGMAVAVLDSGVDAKHPDLAGRVTSKNFTEGPGDDQAGHGTHVASTIAGNGAASGGKYKGVAPEATVLAGKVCTVRTCPESSILAAMQWAAVEQGAKVINMSLGSRNSPSIDPLEEAVNTLTERTGALFVIAAGNSGPADGSVESPGSADAALTVGAVDKSDQLANFSSRGPRLGDQGIKPDITAPGVDIAAARASGTEIGTPVADFPEQYTRIDGTSMAAPHVAGAAALLAQAHPDWKAPQIKAALMAAAERGPAATAMQQGAGRVDVARALTQTIVADPPSVSFGLAQWPHSDDKPIEKNVTFRNFGANAVTLDLALAVTGAGKPAPDGLFTLNASRIEVPAHGTANVMVTGDTRRDVPDVLYSGYLTATNGSATVATPVALDKEPERYSVTLRHLGLDGKPTRTYFTQLFQAASEFSSLPHDPSGTVTVRVPKGRYTTGSYIDTSPAGDGSQQTVLFQPVLDISSDTTVTFDAREAKPVRQAVPDESASPVAVTIGASMKIDGFPVLFGIVQPTFDNFRIGRLGAGAPEHELSGFVASAWAKRDSGARGIDSPYAYHVAEHVAGDAILAGYERTFTAAELAAETQTVRGYVTGQTGFQTLRALDDKGEILYSGSVALRAPAVRVNHYSTAAGIRWAANMMIETPGSEGRFSEERLWLVGAPRSYSAGAQSVQEWGAPPFGPVFSANTTWFGRAGDRLFATVPPDGDAAGHAGRDFGSSVTTKLYRGDTLLAQGAGWSVSASDLAPERATYRVEQLATGGLGGLATEIRSVFTFDSAKPEKDETTPLPVFCVRYRPQLDGAGFARAGKTDRIALAVRDQADKPVAVKKLTFEVSFDDGKTWQVAPVTGGYGSQPTATVTYPDGEGSVSVRAYAEDKTGGTVTQTVIRAYRFKAAKDHG
jgi:subtilisin family serine protease